MERVTISVTEEFAGLLSAFMESHAYDNRSEAIRDLARLGLEQARVEVGEEDGACVATLSYVFNHHTRELSKRLTDAQHGHHDLHVATMHVHLDHESCLEVVVLRGPTRAVRDFAKGVIAERGVTHGKVSFVPAVVDADEHGHGGAPHIHSHTHPRS